MKGYVVMILAFALMIFGIFIAKLYNKRWINMCSIFVGLWMIIISFTKLRLFDMVEVSGKAYSIVFCGCVAFVVGYILSLEIKNNKKIVLFSMNQNVSEEKIYNYNYKMIIFLEIITFIFELIISRRVVLLLRSGVEFSNIHDIVSGYKEATLLTTAIETYLNSWVVMPTIFVIIPIGLILLFNKTEMKWPIILLFLCDIGLYIFIHGARIVLIYVFVYLLPLYGIYNIKISKKVKKRILLLLALAVVSMVILTFLRKDLDASEEGAWDAIMSSVYQYFSVSMILLDHWVEVIDKMEFSSYGLATLHGPLDFIFTFLNKVGLSWAKLSETSQVVSMTEKTFIPGLYNKGEFNAFVSIFYFFYIDFRMIGVVVGSFIYGIFCNISEGLAKKGNPYKISLYLLIAQSVIKSFGRWEFYLVPYCLAFVFLRMCFKKSKKCEEI